ncbi:pyridoxal phosphate-dependent aminotransferase [Sinisalibacter aestuarii]|uniref:Aminotransferase n=1 Tax=Sinisalibacter aestuarii TaxID=2949426 RepID=A0ABQ5LXU6_9RHOB|nr:pyridoxal phosphate-dependent aminotransferase [Sinisalibacter aestuarii]GKY89798.1 aminotransferase [Sinisalibacter aestuarii]
MGYSDRITGLAGGGAAWDVFFRAQRMAAAGEELTMLTIGEPDIGTAPAILDAMHKAAEAGNTGYASIPGIAHLRETVARRVAARTGVETAPENVMITPGGQPALFATHALALDPGQTGLYLDPFYSTYPGTIRGVGGVPVAVATRAEDGFLPRAADLAAAIAAHDAKSLLINSPNNPTGVVYPEATLAEIAGVVREAGIWLISDEVYDTQIWDGSHVSPRSLPGMAERTLVIGSLSKSHAMTGSRVGWVIGPDEAIAHLGNLAIHTTFGVPGYIQEAAAFALTQGPEFEAELAAPFRRRREAALRLIGAQNILRHAPAQGAMYLLLDIRATGLSGQDFAERLLDAERIAVMPGESFGQAAAGHVRVAMTVADDLFEDALARLIAFAGELAA